MPPHTDVLESMTTDFILLIDVAKGKRGWSWERLSHEMGVIPETLSRIRNGHSHPRLETVAKAFAVLDIDGQITGPSEWASLERDDDEDG